MYPVGLRGWTVEMAGLLPSGHALGHQKKTSNYLSLGIPLTLKQNTHLLNSLCSAVTPKRTQRQKKDVIVHEISLYQGRDLTYPQASIPPGSLITKHEDATRKKKKKPQKNGVEEGEQMNRPRSIAWANLWNPACSGRSQCNYTQPVECCPGNAVSKSLEN